MIENTLKKVQNIWAVLDLNKNSQSYVNKDLSDCLKKETVHNPVHNLEICPQLQQIIEAWPELSEQQRKAIVEIVNNRQ